MDRELKEQWPFDDSCISHINEEENEHLMKGIKYSEIYSYDPRRLKRDI
jgi:hypothetical protein